MTVYMSALRRLTFSGDDLKDMGIPSEAVYVSFMYPCAHSSTVVLSDTDCADIALLCQGGFVYLDDKFNPVKILAVLEKNKADESVVKLDFGPPKKLDNEWIQDRLGMFQQVTARWLLDLGVTDFSWIPPGQLCEKGGFAYLGSNLSVGLKC